MIMVQFDKEERKYTVELTGTVEDYLNVMRSLCTFLAYKDGGLVTDVDTYNVATLLCDMIPDLDDIKELSKNIQP